MTVTSQDIRTLANAYRAALATGDGELSASPVEKKLLMAQVAGSAQAIRSHLHTRVPDGDQIGSALDDLIPQLQKENVVGNTLAALEKSARTQAMTLVTTLITGAALPAWLATVVAFVGGVFAFSFDAGQVAGTAIIALLGAGGGALFLVFRVFSVAGPAAANALGQAHTSLWSAVESMGHEAERIFSAVVRPELVRAFGPTQGVMQPRAGTSESGYLKAIVVVTYALLAAAIGFFALGVFSVLDAWSSQPAGPTFPSSP